MPSERTLLKEQRKHEKTMAYLAIAKEWGAAALGNNIIAGALVTSGLLLSSNVITGVFGTKGTPQIMPTIKDGKLELILKGDNRLWWQKVTDGLVAGAFPPSAVYQFIERAFGR